MDRLTPPRRSRATSTRIARDGSVGPQPVFSIGALSQATGIPVETLRTWERRYGFPAPAKRSGSGHRRYPLETVERLRLVVRALDLGHKPSLVLQAPTGALRDLLALTSEVPARGVPTGRPQERGTFVERCLDHVRRLDGDAFVLDLERAYNEVGALEFLASRLGPLLHLLGESWRRGEIEVGHEHFASEHVREFLTARWRPLATRVGRPRVVCATLGGEQHVLGLHMAAMALALGGARVLFLGADTPVADIARAVAEQGAEAVALSAAAGTNRRALERDVKALARALPPGVPIVAGGAGFDPAPPDVIRKPDLAALISWARMLAQPAP